MKDYSDISKDLDYAKDLDYFHCAAPVLKTPKSDTATVTWPVSYTYNGGTVVDGDWYAGFKVPEPVIPAGYRLIRASVGLEMNDRPPHATGYLERE